MSVTTSLGIWTLAKDNWNLQQPSLKLLHTTENDIEPGYNGFPFNKKGSQFEVFHLVGSKQPKTPIVLLSSSFHPLPATTCQFACFMTNVTQNSMNSKHSYLYDREDGYAWIFMKASRNLWTKWRPESHNSVTGKENHYTSEVATTPLLHETHLLSPSLTPCLTTMRSTLTSKKKGGEYINSEISY